jgi:ATPase subunit of ABC transporter with duplicated ATPase domains
MGYMSDVAFCLLQVLRTVYVEHDIDANEAETSVLDFVLEDKTLSTLNVAKDEIVEVLSSVGFKPEMLQQSVGSLSGGWKMKLALGEFFWLYLKCASAGSSGFFFQKYCLLLLLAYNYYY